MPNIKNIKHLEHAALWLFMFLFIIDYYWVDDELPAAAAAKTLLEISTYAAVFYLNFLVLLPRFLEKRRRLGWYALACIATFGLYVWVMQASGLEIVFYEVGGWRNVFSMFLNTTLFLLLSTLFWFSRQWRIEREQQFVLKHEKLEAELKFLRSQISPHFVFNTLNNIYALALQKHDSAAPMVARLSALLRYVLYEADRPRVPLKKELEILREYLDLHLLRKPRSTNFDLYVEGNPDGWQIPPMLLLNFAENCFKHSNIEQDEAAFVRIACEIGPDGALHFSTENSRRPAAPKLEPGGIGLENSRRRLALDFPGEHQLSVAEEREIFRLHLTLQLKKA